METGKEKGEARADETKKKKKPTKVSYAFLESTGIDKLGGERKETHLLGIIIHFLPSGT